MSMTHTHMKQKVQFVQEFTDHLNSIDNDINPTNELEENNALAFLDTLTIREPDGNLKVKVYRKPTHMDQYLNFKSNQPLQHKLSIVCTLHHRAESVTADPEDPRQEKQHIDKALRKCGYPTSAIDKALQPKPPKQGASNSGRGGASERPTIGIPYIKGTTEEIKRVIKRVINSYGIKTYIKATRKLKEILCKPKDRLEQKEVCGWALFIRLCLEEAEVRNAMKPTLEKQTDHSRHVS